MSAGSKHSGQQLDDVARRILAGALDAAGRRLHPGVAPDALRHRYSRIVQRQIEQFGVVPDFMYSCPGRTELIGNHTDHNCGLAVAASIEDDVLACVSERSDGVLALASDIEEQVLSVSVGSGPRTSEQGTTIALMRGIHDSYPESGGASVTLDSRVRPGDGTSSSAAFELILCASMDLRPSGGTVQHDTPDQVLVPDSERLTAYAQNARRAESVYFGKPSGLLDQLACGHGGIILIDFETDPPQVEALPAERFMSEVSLHLIDTGSSHAGDHSSYASVPDDMHEVAGAFAEVTGRAAARSGPSLRHQLRDFAHNWQQVLSSVASMDRTESGRPGDRAILRALHFFEEHQRVEAFSNALHASDLHQCLELMQASGDSSRAYLQNVSNTAATSQPAALTLALLERLAGLRMPAGLVRIHGGGFGGAVLAASMKQSASLFEKRMSEHLPWMKLRPCNIRTNGLTGIGVATACA